MPLEQVGWGKRIPAVQTGLSVHPRGCVLGSRFLCLSASKAAWGLHSLQVFPYLMGMVGSGPVPSLSKKEQKM